MTEHRFTMRLDERYDDERTAWKKLNDIQRRSHLSFSRIIVDAINAYDRDHLHLPDEDEKRLAEHVSEAVADKLQQILPPYLAGYAAGAAAPMSASMSAPAFTARRVPAEPPLKQDTPTADDDMPDFSSSVMDFDFMGS